MIKLALSVIITAHKDRGYLDACVKSVIDNGFSMPYEIILASDGDLSLERYTKRYSKEIVFSCTEKKSNMATNLNVALNKAKGKYLKIIADDDTLVLGSLDALYDLAEKQKADVVFANYNIVNQAHLLTGKYTVPFDDYNGDFIKLITDRKMTAGTTLINLKALNRVGGFDAEFSIAEGHCVYLRLILSGKYKFSYANIFSINYRKHYEQKSMQLSIENKNKRAIEMQAIENKYRIST